MSSPIIWGYRGGSPTAIQAWQPCPLWELSPSHPILVWTRGICCVLCLCLLIVFFLLIVYFVCSFSTLILLVGSFDL